MMQTAAKALVRNYFYQEFLPTHLPLQLLHSGNFLVLLGASQEEEKMLGRLGIAPQRVTSVEHDIDVYVEQSRRERQGELKTRLYFGELSEFISYHLRTNQRFLVLNLDICGSYKSSIDPVMTEVLLFARRNPRTIVATYSNAGRDRPQLFEGLKSLLVLRRQAPASTDELVNQLYGRYREAGLSPSVSFNMVLRHLFWIRSHLEHVLRSAVASGQADPVPARRLFDALESNWDEARQLMRSPLRYGKLAEVSDSLTASVPQPKLFDLAIQTVTTVTYEAFGNFYHLGWFAAYETLAPLRPTDWIERSYQAVLSNPLRFCDQAAVWLDRYDFGDEGVPEDLVIWKGSGLEDPGRQLEMPDYQPELAELGRADNPDSAPTEINLPEKHGFSPTTIQSNGAGPKPLSEQQINKIRQFAAAQADATTDQVISKFRLQAYPRGSVTAHIAIARRQKN